MCVCLLYMLREALVSLIFVCFFWRSWVHVWEQLSTFLFGIMDKGMGHVTYGDGDDEDEGEEDTHGGADDGEVEDNNT